MWIFDFDGVIFDSVPEISISSFNAVRKCLVSDLNDLPQGYLETFRANRFAATRGGDMPVLALWCLENPGEKVTREAFAGFAATLPTSGDELESQFFAARAKLMEQDLGRWISPDERRAFGVRRLDPQQRESQSVHG